MPFTFMSHVLCETPPRPESRFGGTAGPGLDFERMDFGYRRPVPQREVCMTEGCGTLLRLSNPSAFCALCVDKQTNEFLEAERKARVAAQLNRRSLAIKRQQPASREPNATNDTHQQQERRPA